MLGHGVAVEGERLVSHKFYQIAHVTAAVTAGAIAQTFLQPICAARTSLFVGQRPAIGSLYRGYATGLLRQGPVLAVTLMLLENTRAALGLDPM